MENIGDWLYIVVIAVAIISSFLKPKKKQDLNTPPPVAGDRELDTWETEKRASEKKTIASKSQQTATSQQTPSWQDILKSLTEQNPSVSKQEKKKEAKPFIESSLSAENTKTKKNPVQSSISQRIDKFSNEITREEKNSSVKLNFNDIDEIKRGIIYNEIFSRKFS